VTAPPAPSAPRFAVVDYGAGNLVSLDQALRRVGAEPAVVDGPMAMHDADVLVVPGVGAAAPAMDELRRRGLVDPILRWIDDGRPYLGICLGLQLLFDGSDEDGAETLGVLRGRTRLLRDAPTLPHIGWNQVEPTRTHPLLAGINPGADFYFVHSYAGEPEGPNAMAVVIARTTHGRPFVSAVAWGHVLGVQFHPERSGADGLRLLGNAVDLARGGRWPSSERPAAGSNPVAAAAG
jgi:glutamine amidotransferase